MSFKFFTAPDKTKYANETEKDLVESLIELGQQKIYSVHKANLPVGSTIGSHIVEGRNRMFSGFTENKDYMDDNKLVIEKLLAYASKEANISNDVETLKSPRNRQNPIFSSKFFGVISQALPPIITATVNYMFMQIADVRNIGWGDTQHFKVASKDIFTVNKIGKGIKRGAIQRLYSEDIAVNPVNHDITIGLDWYQLVSGRYDLGEWLYRVGLSFTTDITKLVYDQIDSSYASLPTPLQIAGFSDSAFISIAQRVKAANGNIPVYAMGTMLALSSVLPSNDFLKMELGGEYAAMGYLGRYKQVNLLEVPQILVPGTVNTTLTFGIDDTRIYFFSLDTDNPVKLIFEGEAITREEDALSTADGQMVVSVQNMYDAKVASAAIYGILDLNA
jgi:hypothetical protein